MPAPFVDLYAFMQALIATGLAEDKAHARHIINWVAETEEAQ